jgi:hypothetical protein
MPILLLLASFQFLEKSRSIVGQSPSLSQSVVGLVTDPTVLSCIRFAGPSPSFLAHIFEACWGIGMPICLLEFNQMIKHFIHFIVESDLRVRISFVYLPNKTKIVQQLFRS